MASRSINVGHSHWQANISLRETGKSDPELLDYDLYVGANHQADAYLTRADLVRLRDMINELLDETVNNHDKREDSGAPGTY